MIPFDVLISDVPDERLGALLTELRGAGLHASVLDMGGPPAAAPASDELPAQWRLVRELDDQSYAWPKEREQYETYRVYAGDTESGTVHIAIGEARRAQAWGRDRKYLIAFLSSGAPQIPLVEFLEVDDYATTGELLAIIRGSDGGKKMYGPGDPLPAVYADNFHTELYSDRIKYKRSWGKLAVIAHEDDTTTILNHALLQARRRGDA